MTYGPDGKPKYRYVTRPDRTVLKLTPEGNLVETFPPIEDKGRKRSAYSDKLQSDRVRLIPGDKDRMEVIRAIFERSAEGKGLKWIAYHLNERGIPPARGRFWGPLSIRGMLRNPAYIGALVYGRCSDGKHHWLEIERQADGYEIHMERKDVPGRVYVRRSMEECIVVENCHPPLISLDLWEKVQARQRAQKMTKGHGDHRTGRSVGSPYLLSGDGLMKCRSCGYAYNGKTDPRNAHRYYYDSGYEKGGNSICRCTYIPAEEIEGWVLDRIEGRFFGRADGGPLSAKGLEEEIAAQLQGVPEAKLPDMGPDIERELEEKRRKVKLLFANLDEDTLSFVKPEIETLKREIRSLEARVTESKRLTPEKAAKEPRARAREIAGRVLELRQLIKEGTPDEKKTLIRLFVSDIAVDPKEGVAEVGF